MQALGRHRASLGGDFRLSVSEPGKVYPVSLGEGTIKVTAPDGSSRTLTLTVNKTSGADEFGIDAPQIVSEEYFSLQGVRIPRPAPGTICIVRTVWTDGATTTAKQVAR